MKKILYTTMIVFCLLSFFMARPAQAQAFSFPGYGFSGMRRMFPHPQVFLRPRQTLHWQQLSQEEKLAKLDLARVRVKEQIHKAHTIMLLLEKLPPVQEKALEVDAFLIGQDAAIDAAETPEQLEAVVKQTQRTWLLDKSELKEILRSSSTTR